MENKVSTLIYEGGISSLHNNIAALENILDWLDVPFSMNKPEYMIKSFLMDNAVNIDSPVIENNHIHTSFQRLNAAYKSHLMHTKDVSSIIEKQKHLFLITEKSVDVICYQISKLDLHIDYSTHQLFQGLLKITKT